LCDFESLPCAESIQHDLWRRIGKINPVLDAAANSDDFLLTDIRKKRMTMYVGIQPNKLAESD